MTIAAEDLAQLFHETYEALAPAYGYKTRDATAVPWDKVPEPNRQLMIAVADAVLTRLGQPPERAEMRNLIHRMIPPSWQERERRSALREAYEEAEKLLGCWV